MTRGGHFGERELCPSCGANTAGWGSGDCGRQAWLRHYGGPSLARGPGLRRRSGYDDFRPPAPPSLTPLPRPTTIRGRGWSSRTGAAIGPPLAPPLGGTGIGERWQPRWLHGTSGSGDYGCNGNCDGGGGDECGNGCGTAEAAPTTPAQAGDDPWEPHPWASRVQPAWGGSWA